MVFSPDGGILVTGDADGVLRVWDAATGRARTVLAGHSAPIYTAAFSPDGTLLAVGDTATLRLYDAASGTVIRELDGHRGPVYRAAFSPANCSTSSPGTPAGSTRSPFIPMATTSQAVTPAGRSGCGIPRQGRPLASSAGTGARCTR
jgi:WD40 repeat protein